MINFPTALDVFTNPTAGQSQDAPGVEHDVQHANLNDAVEALQAKVGVNGSGVATSHDYLIRQIFQAIFNTDANIRFQDGQIQFWDDAAYAADNTRPWRALGCNAGQTVWSAPIAD